jgi:hypothetical protein
VNRRYSAVRKGGRVELRRKVRVLVEPKANRVLGLHLRLSPELQLARVVENAKEDASWVVEPPTSARSKAGVQTPLGSTTLASRGSLDHSGSAAISVPSFAQSRGTANDQICCALSLHTWCTVFT